MVKQGSLVLSVAASRDQVSFIPKNLMEAWVTSGRRRRSSLLRQYHLLCAKLLIYASPVQEDKIYVQHRIPELAAVVWDYLQRGGFLYVCGSVAII